MLMTITIFSRLSARVQDSDGEEELSVSGPAPVVKRVKLPSAVSRQLPTRAAVLRAQGGDEQARTRNRRMFGSLLGTLQKFKQEEIVLQTKVKWFMQAALIMLRLNNLTVKLLYRQYL